MRDIVLTSQAFDDLQFWSANNIKLIKKILELLESVNQNPFAGLGKPEALKGNLRGYWSRRINEEHRLVYTITDAYIIVISCRSHYNI